MSDLDRELRDRLAVLESHAPGGAEPPSLRRSTRRRSFAASMSAAPVLLLALVATAAGGAVVVSNLAQSAPGIQNPGQPLAGAQMECLTPPQAAAFLAERGYTDVVWQIESGDPVAGKDATTTVQQDVAPDHGFVIPGSIIDGRLHMIVDQQVGVTGVGACYGAPQP